MSLRRLFNDNVGGTRTWRRLWRLLNDDIRNSVSYKKDEVLLPGVNIRMFGSIKLN